MKKTSESTADVMLPVPRPWTLSIEDASDAQCDSLLPPRIRRASSVFWTPVRVARRAAELFADLGVSRVLDVGSGPGKFCVVAGAHRPSITFVGIDHRKHLIAAAQSLAAAVDSKNVTFACGDVTRLPWCGFDGFYVFNSFAENDFSADGQLDTTVPLSPVRKLEDLLRVERWLAAQDEGTVLVTYHGLGGPIPTSYVCVRAERAGTDWLRAWRKRDATPSSKLYWLEDGPELHVATLAGAIDHVLPPRFRKAIDAGCPSDVPGAR